MQAIKNIAPTAKIAAPMAAIDIPIACALERLLVPWPVVVFPIVPGKLDAANVAVEVETDASVTVALKVCAVDNTELEVDVGLRVTCSVLSLVLV